MKNLEDRLDRLAIRQRRLQRLGMAATAFGILFAFYMLTRTDEKAEQAQERAQEATRTIERFTDRQSSVLTKFLATDPKLRREVITYYRTLAAPRPKATPKKTPDPGPVPSGLPTQPPAFSPGVTPPPESSPIQLLVCELTGAFCQEAVNEVALAIAFVLWSYR